MFNQPKTKLNNRGFSLVELTVSLIVIAVIIAILTPVISKRLTAATLRKNKISTDCDRLYPDGYCAMCYIFPKSCITCTKNCNTDEYKNVSSCVCKKCSVEFNDIHCSRCNSKKCLQCEDGYYLDGSNKCVICPKGYYCFQNKEISIKEMCPLGTANSKLGQSVCTDCVKSDAETSGSVALNKGMINCESCIAGKYAKNNKQSDACEICPLGYYCPAGKLIPCPLGYANGSLGAVSCSKCNKSSDAATGSVAASEAMTSCSACGNGSYAAVEGQTTSCTTCPAGFYCPAGKIIPCPAGYYCPANSTAPTACKINQTSNAGASICINCTTGCSTCLGSANNCTNCAAGYYKNGTYCVKCPANSYCVDNKKINCPAGYTAPIGSTGAAACKSAFDCKKYGGSVTGNYCYKKITFVVKGEGYYAPSCGSITDGHTWTLVNSSNINNFCNIGLNPDEPLVLSESCYSYIRWAEYNDGYLPTGFIDCNLIKARCGFKGSGPGGYHPEGACHDYVMYTVKNGNYAVDRGTCRITAKTGVGFAYTVSAARYAICMTYI